MSGFAGHGVPIFAVRGAGGIGGAHHLFPAFRLR
jgi:hypothetical protein